ncbi:hypothetical protein [Rhizobium sp. MHM7A]|uniref:hypothetical protein n=1 Tax=Rhizobium sp. MHM7A TaxID=2583233 RepID=UPI001106A11E|nr:hypothetical protein [Rhizobium sp. MHM7A]TLX16698.1 hypothetical protein FFR93_04975 [Rhizobium sp. MHM7A]
MSLKLPSNLVFACEALERSVKAASKKDAAILDILLQELRELATSREMHLDSRHETTATNAEILAKPASYTAINLPNQDDGFNWSISEDGKGLVCGLDNKPVRFMTKGEAEASIERMAPVPRPKRIGFAKASDVISVSLGHKLKPAMMKQQDELHAIPVFVKSEDWRAIQAQM